MNDDMQREAFEQRFVFVLNFDRGRHGSYVASRTFDTWSGFRAGWQAAIRHLTEHNEQMDSHE
jgi:hypothetical protein